MLPSQLALFFVHNGPVSACFISASNEPSAVPARAFDDCRKGETPRSLLRFQAMMPRSLLWGISLANPMPILHEYNYERRTIYLHGQIPSIMAKI